MIVTAFLLGAVCGVTALGLYATWHQRRRDRRRPPLPHVHAWLVSRGDGKPAQPEDLAMLRAALHASARRHAEAVYEASVAALAEHETTDGLAAVERAANDEGGAR